MLTKDRRAALVALLLLVPMPTVGTLFAMVFESTRGTIGPWVYGASKVWILALPLAWRLLVDREPPSWSPPRQGGLGMGLLLGALIAVVIGAVYLVVGRTWIDPTTVRDAAVANGIGTLWRYAGFGAYLILVNSLLEEYVWRWFVFRKCETATGHSGAAIVLSGLFFTLHHVVALKAQLPWNATLLASAGVFVGGVVWSWCYCRYRSIWPGYVSHVGADVAILVIGWQMIFGTA